MIKEANYEMWSGCGKESSLSHFIFSSMGELEERALGNSTKSEYQEESELYRKFQLPLQSSKAEPETCLCLHFIAHLMGLQRAV